MVQENENTQTEEQNLGEGGEQTDGGEDTTTNSENGSEENGSESGEQSTEDTSESGEDTTDTAVQGSEEEEETAEQTSDNVAAGYATTLEKEVEFEGKKIEAVLNDGRATETQYHCKFADGTTGHVPKEFLDKELAQE